jgi:hypothetical protein
MISFIWVNEFMIRWVIDNKFLSDVVNDRQDQYVKVSDWMTKRLSHWLILRAYECWTECECIYVKYVG